MASEWQETQLGKVVKLLSGGTPSKARSDFWNGNIPWLSAKDMKNFWVEDTEDHLTESGAANATRIVPAGTTLLLVRGMTLHNDIPICRTRKPCAFNQDVKAVIALDGLDNEYLPYLLVANKDRLQGLVDSAGHGTGRLNSDTLLNLPIRIPSLETQKQLANFACTLDDKIELNRQMNATLEAMAQALFKSWFVDFDPVKAKAEGRAPEGMDAETAALFPSEFQNSELGPIPRGWRCLPLIEALEINPIRRLVKGAEANYLDMANVPTQGHRPISWITRTFSSGTKFINGDTLLARITPCLENGKTAFVDFLPTGETGWGSTEFIVLRPNPPLPEYFAYLLCREPNFRSFAIQSMTGTSGRQRVQTDSLGKYLIAIPTNGVGEWFGDVIAPLIENISRNSEESSLLAEIRDALLPKLISGQLRIPTAEATAEAAL